MNTTLQNSDLDDDYGFIQQIVYKLSRISLGPQKKQMVISRIAKRMRALGHKSVREYCDFLKKPSGRTELSSLIDVISTNHTYFFREASHFDYLTRTILHQRRGKRKGVFRVWSAACSSGEEPYSVAMILSEQARVENGFDWQMEATDISSIVLAKAQAGGYPEASLSRVPEVLRKRYLHQQQDEDLWTVDAKIKKKIRFSRLNLFEIPDGFPAKFDLIICRNVMIYFDRPTREQLVNSLTQRLVDDGTFFVGHSESLGGLKHQLKMIRPAIYEKDI
jgi:chemotaxis protein methyltransferase CheR